MIGWVFVVGYVVILFCVFVVLRRCWVFVIYVLGRLFMVLVVVWILNILM